MTAAIMLKQWPKDRASWLSSAGYIFKIVIPSNNCMGIDEIIVRKKKLFKLDDLSSRRIVDFYLFIPILQ